MDYNKQATDFLQSTNTEMKVEFVENGIHFDGDKDTRDIYKVTFKRGNRSFSLRFGQSLVNSAKIVDTVTGNEFTLNGGRLRTFVVSLGMIPISAAQRKHTRQS